ncbi:MAG: YesL family protein [Ruminococcus sp.]|nr:YesL family protein [Ruminococcus sp.]
MKKLLDLDSPVIRLLGRLTDLMALNIIFLASCLPVITVGAAWTALYYVTLKMVRNEESYIFSSYWKAFRENFRQATVIWGGVLCMLVVLVLDFRMTGPLENGGLKPLQMLLAGVGLLFSMLVLYVFPLLARFQNTIPKMLQNALLIAVRHLPSTIAVMAVTAGSVSVTFLSSQTFVYGIPFWALFGFAVTAYANSWFFRRVFEKYE